MGGRGSCLTCVLRLSRQSAHVAEKCFQGLKPKPVRNEPVLISLSVSLSARVCVRVCMRSGHDSSSQCLSACSSGYGFSFTVCTQAETGVCVVCLTPRLYWQSAEPPFFFFFVLTSPLLPPVCITIHLPDLSPSFLCFAYVLLCKS